MCFHIFSYGTELSGRVKQLFLCHFTWCITELVAPELKLVQKIILFMQISKLSEPSLHILSD